MQSVEFENQSRLDLETALAQVRANIQADCRILSIETTDFSEFGQLSVNLAVGESEGREQWDYQNIPVTMIRCYFDCDLELYHEGTPEQISNYWSELAEKLTSFFFTKNPDYQQALFHE